jgi:hypothetical protein
LVKEGLRFEVRRATHRWVTLGFSDYRAWTLALRHQLIHRERDVYVPGDVGSVARFHLMEDRRIDDMPAVFKSIRAKRS